jgi:hypothetical protein
MTRELLLQLLLGLTPYHGDTETELERRERLAVVAEAIDTVTKSEEEQVWLVAQGEGESNFAEHVHEGRCRPLQCDPTWVRIDGKRVRIQKARGPWQVQPVAGYRGLWETIQGSDLASTTAGARIAIELLRARRCGGRLPEMFGAQGGRGCVATPTGKRKAYRVRQLRLKLARMRQ